MGGKRPKGYGQEISTPQYPPERECPLFKSGVFKQDRFTMIISDTYLYGF